MANVIEIVATYKDQATRGLTVTTGSLKDFGKELEILSKKSATLTRSDQVVRWGDAWGTASKKAQGGATALSGSFGAVDQAAKQAAVGGLAKINAEIPILGSALSGVASKLTGFPLLLGGIVGVGAGVISFLQSLSDEAGKGLASITTTAEGIGTQLKATVLEVARVTAEAVRNRTAVIEAGFQKEVALAETAKQERIAKAREELEASSGIWATLTGQRAIAEAKFTSEAAAAEAELATKTIALTASKTAQLIALERERIDFITQLNADVLAAEETLAAARAESAGKALTALEATLRQEQAAIQTSLDQRLEAIEKLGLSEESANRLREKAFAETQVKLTLSEEQGAQKRKVIIESAVNQSIAIFQKLGPAFERTTKQLTLAQFIQESGNAIKTLTTLLEAVQSGDQTLKDAGLTMKDVTDAIKAYTDAMQQAKDKGTIPLTKSTQDHALASEALTQKIIGNTTALANLGKTQAESDQITRSLLDGTLLQTRSFDEMGRELDSLKEDYVAITQEMALYTAKTATLTGTQKEAETAISSTTKEIEGQRAATVELNAELARQATAIATLNVAGADFAKSMVELRKQLAAVGEGASFAFVQDPKLRDQIETLRRDIVQASGEQRIRLVEKLDALLKKNEDQLKADQVAAQIRNEWKALDERRNQILEQIKQENIKLREAFFAFAAQQAGALGRPAAHAGGIIRARGGVMVPGSGSGDKVPALLEPGELVIPRDLTRELFGLGRRSPRRRFQGGGIVGAGAGGGDTFVFNLPPNGLTSEQEREHIARDLYRRFARIKARRAGVA